MEVRPSLGVNSAERTSVPEQSVACEVTVRQTQLPDSHAAPGPHRRTLALAVDTPVTSSEKTTVSGRSSGWVE